MNGKQLLSGLSEINRKYIEESEMEPIVRKTKTGTRIFLRKHILIAAIIALMVVFMGCGVVYMLSMKGINIGQQQTLEDVFDYDPESGQAVAYLGQESVTEEVLTLAGIQGSPNYQAAQEWFTFKQAYDPDHAILQQLQKNDLVPEFPEEYQAYNLYSQEMKQKLDEILEKYDLKLIGRTIPFKTEELVCKALGLDGITAPGSDAVTELDYAEYQECGNLNMDFRIIIPDDGGAGVQNTRCHIYFLRKDAFTEDVISLREMVAWKEWIYTTASGTDVLIFRSDNDWRGYIFCDMPNYTVTLRYEFIDEQYSSDAAGNVSVQKAVMTDQEIERLADAIDFSIEPKLAEGWESLTDSTADSGKTIDGYSIELKSVESDGTTAVITLGITAPEDIDLLEQNGYPLSLKHSNRWGFFEPVTECSGNVSGGYAVEDDGDGKANTQNVVLKYSAGSEQIRNREHPFASGQVWNIYWQDLYASYLNEKTNEPEEYLLVQGTWSFDVVFEDVTLEELELITTPVAAKASYGWDMKGNDIYQDTMITSFLLRPMSASIICDIEQIAPDFLTDGDGCVYAITKDGSTIALYSDSASSGVQNLRAESTIDLDQVVSVLLPDGTELPVPQA